MNRNPYWSCIQRNTGNEFITIYSKKLNCEEIVTLIFFFKSQKFNYLTINILTILVKCQNIIHAFFYNCIIPYLRSLSLSLSLSLILCDSHLEDKYASYTLFF